MDCEVAREALSARMDGEREPVPSVRVDEHLEHCADCRAWHDRVTPLTAHLRQLAAPSVTVAGRSARRIPRAASLRVAWPRWALIVIGVVQFGLAGAQGFGLYVGLPHDQGMAHSGHLLNESTAWSLTLGIVMIGAGIWPVAAAGLAGVLALFTGVLTVYVVIDAASGAVTSTRILSHVPVILGAVLALLVWRRAAPKSPTPAAADEPDIVLPHNASRGRRRGHLWPTDGSAA